VWAEAFALGEMEMDPAAFWKLTPREFLLKQDGFSRREDRALSLVLRHALMTGHYKKQDRNHIGRAVNALKRYPIKTWLQGT
jgi:hypothetical protein